MTTYLEHCICLYRVRAFSSISFMGLFFICIIEKPKIDKRKKSRSRSRSRSPSRSRSAMQYRITAVYILLYSTLLCNTVCVTHATASEYCLSVCHCPPGPGAIVGEAAGLVPKIAAEDPIPVPLVAGQGTE